MHLLYSFRTLIIYFSQLLTLFTATPTTLPFMLLSEPAKPPFHLYLYSLKLLSRVYCQTKSHNAHRVTMNNIINWDKRMADLATSADFSFELENSFLPLTCTDFQIQKGIRIKQ